ncbi:hypothetical protein, partial [Burkholderia cenocepacia]
PTFVIARNPASTSATQRGSDASDLDTLARSEQWLVMHAPAEAGGFGGKLADALAHAGYPADIVDFTHAADAIASLPV